MELKTLENLSDEMLELEQKESERYSELYSRLANQGSMSENDIDSLSAEVKKEISSLEKASSNLRKSHLWASKQADELKTRLNEGRKSEKGGRLLRRAPANSVIDYEERRLNNFAAGINFYKIAIICISGSFAGVIIEMLWCLIRNGYIESRAGLVYGPFNLLYGVGAVAMTLMLYRYRNRSASISLVGGMAVGSIIEYILSWAQETVFGSTSWDYSDIPFNLNGRICLLYSFFWGILGVMWIKSIYPRIAKLILKIPNKAGKILTVAFSVFLVFNAVMTFGAVWRWSERIDNRPAASFVDDFFDKRFPDSRMERIFANMEFGD